MLRLRIAQRPRPGFVLGCHRSARFPERKAHAGKGPRAARGPWWRRAQRALPCRVCYDGKNNGRPFPLPGLGFRHCPYFFGLMPSRLGVSPTPPHRVSGREEQGSAGAAACRQVGRAGGRRPAATNAPESRCAWPVAPQHHEGTPKQRSAACLRAASETGRLRSAPRLFRCSPCARRLTVGIR
jgi:hypothetical protein